MSYLADTNILVRSAQQNHPLHVDTLEAVKSLLSRGESVHIFAQNIIEFWNVCTRPIDKNGLGLTPQQTSTEATRLEALLNLLPDTPAIYTEWRKLVVAHAVSGVKVHDARLVAGMQVYGIQNILTLDQRDFARYGVTVVRPQDVQRGPNLTP